MMLLPRARFTQIAEGKSSKELFKDHPFEILLFSLLPKKHRLAYRWHSTATPKLEPILRAQLVVDYLSGMTDSHAWSIHNMINGTKQIAVQ
jgi:dGTP triphosphohydrolase